MKKSMASDLFRHAAVWSPDGGLTQVVLVTRTIGDMRAIWNKIDDLNPKLDESKIKDVEVIPRRSKP